MKQNNKSTIAIIALLIVIIILLLGIMVFFITGGSLNLPKNTFNSSEKQEYSESFVLDSNKEIEISTEFGNINIKKGDGTQLVVEGENYSRSKIKAVVKQNKIVIDREFSGSGLSSFKGVNFTSCNIDVYIPDGYEGKISAEVDAGNITADTDLKGIIDFEADAGNIEVKSITGKFDLSVNMGNIKINEAEITANSSAENDMGNIEIEKLNPIRVIAEADMGAVSVNGADSSSPITLKAETDMGNIEIN